MIKRHKYNAKPVNHKGIRFHSTLEYQYYLYLKRLEDERIVVFFHRQVAFDLPGGAKYVTDYQVFYADGTVHYVDVKGVETPDFKMKKKMVEATYPVEIEVVKKGMF